MKKLTLYQVITNEVRTDDRLNPFLNLFDPQAITALLDEAIAAKYGGNVEYDADGGRLVTGLRDLNSLYHTLLSEVKGLLIATGLNGPELIDATIARANFGFLDLLAEQRRQMGKSSGKVEELNRMVQGDFRNLNGSEIGAVDISDAINDSAHRILKVIVELNIDSQNAIQIGQKQIMSFITKALQLASIIDALVDNFDECIYETAIVKANIDNILFEKVPPAYYLIRQANRYRRQNQVMEFALTGMKYPESGLIKPGYEISKGKVTLLKGSTTDNNRNETQVLVEMVTFNNHLIAAKLDGDDAHTVRDLVRLYTLIKIYFGVFNDGLIADEAVRTQNYEVLPFRINQQHLLEVLSDQSGLDHSFVFRFLQALSQPLGIAMDIWAKPLLQNGTDYLFLLGPVSSGHATYQLETIIGKFIRPERQLSLFKAAVVLDLKKTKYTFEQLDTKGIGGELKTEGLLVYRLLTQVVVIELVDSRIRLDTASSADEMAVLFSAAVTLRRNIELISGHLEQIAGRSNYVVKGLLLTKHAVYSGIVIEGFSVMDIILLQNYVDRGMYTRAMITAGNHDLHDKPIASYPYYKDDDTFDKNLSSFMYYPAPVVELVRNLKIQNFQLTPTGSPLTVFSQHAELRTLGESMDEMVLELEDTLKQLYYFQTDYDKEPEGKRLIEERINFLMPLTFSYFAVDRQNTEARLVLLRNFRIVGFDGLIYLITNLDRSLITLGKKKVVPSVETDHPETNHDKADQQFKELADLISKTQGSKVLSPSNFSIEHGMNDMDRDNLVAYLISLISAYNPGVYTEEELDSLLFILTFAAGLGHQVKRFEKDLSTSFLNVIDLLNHNNLNQRARDMAEEALAYSFKYEPVPVLGWLALFKCFTAQRNALDAAFYGNAYIAALFTLPEVPVHMIFDGFYNALIFYRNFGFSAIVDRLYKGLIKIPLDNYDLQKLTLSYLQGKISDIENIESTLQLAEQFLNKNILEIMKHGQQGALPWISLLYNLINLENAGFITLPASIKMYLPEFEKKVEEKTLNNIRGYFFPEDENSLGLLKDALVKSFETRNALDFASEISRLELLANNVVKLAVNDNDAETLLLSGFVINDQTLVFEHGLRDILPIFDGEGISAIDFVENYGQHLLANLPVLKGQVFIWLFEYGGTVGMLSVNEEKDTIITALEDWNMHDMRSWLKDLPNYYFDDKQGYPINFQEQDYIRDLDRLKFSRLPVPFPFNELLIAASLELAPYPPNILQVNADRLDMSKIETHEAVVEDYVMNQAFDFVGFSKPVTNVVSAEFLTVNGSVIEKNKEELTFACWIPTVDDDIPLYIAESKLMPILTEKYGVVIQTSIYPKPPLSANVNFFVAHGYKTVMGFRSVHTRQQDEGHALSNDTGISRVFGSGFIAVIFICDSGAMTKDIYKQQLNSFVNEILSLGYKAVVAPAWRYNPSMTGIWTETFIESLTAGLSVSFSVQEANHSAAKNGFDPPVGFYAPQGWSAMHLYGNPNLYFK